jgi:hypothetical protein
MARTKLYTVRREICITPEQEKEIRRIAKEKNLTINQVIRNIIESCI